MATAWSQTAPPSPVRAVEDQRKRVQELRAQLDPCRQARDDARAAVVQAERSDREAMAAALAAGKAATSDVQSVEKANAAAAATTRQFEALQLAIANAEAELGAVVQKHRDAWAKRAAGEVSAARNDAREALDGLRAAFARYSDARQIVLWLTHGLDRPAALGLLGSAPGSERWAANGEQVGIAIVLDQWLAAALAEPEPAPQASPSEPAPTAAD
jgi:hypothetical protein